MYLVDVHVRAHGRADGVAVADDEVDNTRREAGLVDERAGAKGSERSELGRLEDNRVPRRQRGADLPGKHEEGEVPGDDLADDTDRLVAGIGKLRLVGLRKTVSWRTGKVMGSCVPR